MDWRRRAPVVVLGAMIAVYVVVFGTLTWRQHTNYGTFGFDMGLHDQGIWLTSRFTEPFVTVRGMNYYGHHVNLVSVLYVPLYWLGAGPRVLYLTQTMSLALGAMPLWLIARRRSSRAWLALAPAAAWLLHPSVEWITWWHWHPEAMAITPLLFAWWFAVERRWRWFAAMVVFALACKEDVALAVAMLGIVLALWRPVRSVRAGAITAAGAVVWFGVCTRLIIPAILGDTPFYERNLFPEFGDSMESVAFGIVTQPGKVASMAFEAGRLEYYAQMVTPFGISPLLGLPLLVVAGPQTLVNVLSALPGTYDIRFQYSSMVLVGVALAATEGLGRIATWRAGRATRLLTIGLAVTTAASAIASNVVWSPSPLGRGYDTGVWASRIPRHDVFDKAVALVPDDASVTATYYMIPHLTHRRAAYEWPNPWKLVNWGLSGEAAPDPSSVDYVVLDTTLDQEPDLLAEITAPSGNYDVILAEDFVVVACRRDICP
ncbi:MAG TPA: DUF2079 domain-containing protein [Acidimicrobiales bacterium]|nr:DUF2079 domain-containing protein [Acidimicrobiales bacterium]